MPQCPCVIRSALVLALVTVVALSARAQFPGVPQDVFPITLRGLLSDDFREPLRRVPFTVVVRDNGRRTGTTDSQGEFSVTDITVRPGTYDVTIEVKGFEPTRVDVTVPAGARGATLRADAQLRRQSFSIVDDPSRPPPARTDVPNLIWNAWAERQPDGVTTPSYRPVEVVGRRDTILVTLHLSGIEYGTSAGVVTQSAGAEFRDKVKEWLGTDAQNIDLRAVLLADPAYFENPYLRESPLTVGLAKVRAFVPNPAVGKDVFATLRLDPEAGFVFGHMSVGLKTRGRTGWAPMSIALWSSGRPIEEVPFAVCISSDLTKAASVACPEIRPARSTLGGFDSLRSAIGQGSQPDVALHVTSLPGNGEVFGVMAMRGVQSKIAWPIEGGIDELRKALAGPMFERFATADSDLRWLEAGKELRNLLFPDDAPEKPAEQFDTAVEAAVAAGRPSVYVRVLQTPAFPFVFPIGAIQTGEGLLGLKARMELPLPHQVYAAPGACVTQWALVAPPLGYDDDALKVAREVGDLAISTWANVSFPFDKMTDFGVWLQKKTPELTRPTGVFVLSHHDKDLLHFVKKDQIGFKSVSRAFPEPSIVVLNACGGARTSAQGFVNEFNKHGATSIVATITEVEADMAGEFTTCWGKEIADLPAGGSAVGDVFARVQKCLHDLQDGTGASRFGAKVLKYVLLGDGSTRLCPAPKQPQRP